jgi:hypothetical protein
LSLSRALSLFRRRGLTALVGAIGAVILASTAPGALTLEGEGTRYIYDGVLDVYDIEANNAQMYSSAPGASAGLTVGVEGDAKPVARPVGHVYDASSSFVAPTSALDDALPNSGPIPQSLGAASRAEQLARKLNLNVNSPTTRQVLNSLDTDVSSFVSQYRRGSIWRELPGEVTEMTVEDALQYSSTVRKLLIDNRFVK